MGHRVRIGSLNARAAPHPHVEFSSRSLFAERHEGPCKDIPSLKDRLSPEIIS
jgi:hypothetical protein